MQAQLIVGPSAQCQRQIGPVAKDLPEFTKLDLAGLIGLVGHENGKQALGIERDIVEVEDAVAFAAALLAACSIFWP